MLETKKGYHPIKEDCCLENIKVFTLSKNLPKGYHAFYPGGFYH